MTTPSFDDFYAYEYRRVLGLAVVLCGRRAVAEELTQDAFVAAFKRWDAIARYDNPGAWIRRVVVNLASSLLRRRTREARVMAKIALRRQPDVEVTFDDGAFWDAVRGLPRRQAQCAALRYLEDRSITEIAELLGLAEVTVRVHLHGARTTLADRLGEQLDEESS